MLLLLDLRLACRASAGSCGFRPLALANRFSTSVRLITPLNLPDNETPAIADAEIAGAGVLSCLIGMVVVADMLAEGSGVIGEGGTRMAGVAAGVGGPDDAGDGVSTTHIRWERVATSFATVCASVENGVMWKTGKESLPSFMPRSDRITLMKWMHEERRRGREVDFVRSCRRLA
jgi:hypothetical protein